MNVSAPFPASISGVDFGFLTRKDIRASSVKRIQHTETISPELGHPIPGGLYDQALGTRGEYPCTTCNLGHFCPGHAGHIQLPVTAYHPVFMDQLMKMLNGQCGSCLKFRMSRVELHRYASKLKLLRYGLIEEAHEIDSVGIRSANAKPKPGEEDIEASETDSVAEESEHATVSRRNKFISRAIRSHGKDKLLAGVQEKVESLAEERRFIIKEFMSAITKGQKCANCQAASPRFRKDGYNKIFKQPLSQKLRGHNAQFGLKLTEPLLERARVHSQAAEKKRKRRELESDEGIAMEVDDLSDEMDEENLYADDTNLTSGDILDTAAVVGAKKVAPDPEDRSGQEYVLPTLVYARMEELFREEQEILGFLYNSRARSGRGPLSPDMFFIQDVVVTPNKYRPDMRTGSGMITEADQNTLYKVILNNTVAYSTATKSLRQAEPGSIAQSRAISAVNQAAISLQDAVNSLIDTDKNPMNRGANSRAAEGIKQKLEKKEGLFRMNMMGKRVNFAARSVISPDPNIETNEIGVPPVFAKKLTYPEPVTNHNFYELKQAVLNGPSIWPGAAAIENENGQVINLKHKNFEERQALANQLLAPSSSNVSGARGKKVHRHLNNGDIVIMNRQPTLHKPSMMCHRARVLPGEKTIRMHYANCNTYNADFDGDEMNMHFPQNESARAEAIFIADTDHQYLSATAGKPLRGLIQDHLSMGVWLTNKDTFFDRDDYHQLLYSCLRPETGHLPNENIVTLPPSILKPKALWSGKQIFSTILKNIQPPTHPGLTMTGKSQVAGERWVKGELNEELSEGTVIFRDGELLCGILDKAQLGPAKGGFIHSIYETYGNTIAGRLLSIIGRMLTKLEHMRAFSCGMEDIVFTQAGNERRREHLRAATDLGREIAAKYVALDSQPKNDPLLKERLEEVLRDDAKQHGLDTVYNSKTGALSSAITKACLPSGLFKDFPKNQMQAMTTSGAKGSAVNANLISCNLGQQVLEGRRTPTMVSGKTLPAFKPFETHVRAGGYIVNRFLTGVQPQEYYFHTMAGREGLIDTAVKTSRSGYLQRCIIKGMEGLQVSYDTSVRDADGSMIQFLYGEDGLDITKQAQLTNFKFQAENWKSLAAELNTAEGKQLSLRNEEAIDANEKALKKYRKTGDLAIADPVTSRYFPNTTWGATSEKFLESLKGYMKENPQKVLYDKKTNSEAEMKKKNFQMLMEMKYLRSLIDPGEPVGIVAGQSIGEPSTQMTLNTFHLAGHSAKNVTLGIPRLREIVMTASAKIATPQMELWLHDDIEEDVGKTFAKGITKLTLAEVIDSVIVQERIGKGVVHTQARIFDVRLNFFPPQEYQETYAITEEDVARSVELKFVPALEKAIKKEMKDKSAAQHGKSAAQPDVGKSAGKSEGTSEKDTVGGATKDHGDPDDNEGREKARTDDVDSEESDMDDESDNDKPDKGGKAYDGDSDDEAIANAAREGSEEPEDRDAPHDDEGYGGSPRPHDMTSDSEDGDDENEENDVVSSKKRVSKDSAAARADRLVGSDKLHVTDFTWDTKTRGAWCEISLEYDIKTPKILMLHLVESSCRTAVVQSITGIDSATIDKKKVQNAAPGEKSEQLTVLTDGVNLLAMHDYQNVINPDKIFTNDIVAMLNTYGVEAGRATIVREMNAVFEGHSISVDHRHLNLIADYMTRNGGFLAFSRTGMKSGVSPFAKMSFETTVGFLRDAVMDGDYDDLRGPSARIVTGRTGKIGTGAFDVLMPVA